MISPYTTFDNSSIAYFDEIRANVLTIGQSSNTLTTLDKGLVVYDNVSNLELIKDDGRIDVFGPDRMRDATHVMADRLKIVDLVYKRPHHIQERIRPDATLDEQYLRVLVEYFGWNPESFDPLCGGRGRTVFLVEEKKGRKGVFKLLEQDRDRALLLTRLQSSSDVFPKLFPVLHKDEKVVGDYLVEIAGSYYLLEEFITADHSPRMDANYYYRFGRNLGSFHNQMRQIQTSISVGIAALNSDTLPPNLTDVAALDFAIAKHRLTEKKQRLLPVENFLLENYDFLTKQLEALKRSGYIRIFSSLPKQIVHGDISSLHSLWSESDVMQLIDIETISYISRTYEFPIALIGRGSGNPSEYVPGSFRRLIEGYNETIQEKLSQEEIETIKFLVAHRFLRMLHVWLIRNPIHEVKRLEVMVDSLHHFLEENPPRSSVLRICRKRIQVPTAVPFNIPTPLELFSANVIGEKSGADAISIRQRLKRNIFYADAPQGLRDALPDRITALSAVVKLAIDYFACNYPDLEIINISLFGSFLYSDSPHDIDLLVIVRGNHYLLVDISFHPADYGLQEQIPSSVEQIGISIKGEENLSRIVFDPAVSVREESQKPVLERSAAVLYHRHVTLLGPDFQEIAGLFSENSLAEASDLLINVYHRFYLDNPKYILTPHEKARKILYRLYEASVYLYAYDPQFEISPADVRGWMSLLSDAHIDLPDVARFYEKFITSYERVHVNLELLSNIKRDERRTVTPMSLPLTNGDRRHIKELVDFAKRKIQSGELGDFLPVAARIVDLDGNVITTALRVKYEQHTQYGVFANHAEMKVIEEAEAKGFSDWGNATLYTTLEPCLWCSRSVAESFRIGRVIYGIEDTTLAEYLDNRQTFARQNIELRQCADEGTRQELLSLFCRLRESERYGSDAHREQLHQRQDLTFKFSEGYRNASGRKVQTEYFDADLLLYDSEDEAQRLFWLSQLEMFQRNRNPEQPHILLFGGAEQHQVPALKEIFADGVFSGRIIFVSTGESFEMDDFLWAVRGEEAYVFDYDNTLTEAGEAMGAGATDLLAKLLLAGYVVALATARAKNRIEQGDINPIPPLVGALKHLGPDLTDAELRQLFSNFILYTSRGAEKYRFVYDQGRLIDVMDERYYFGFTEKERLSILEVIAKIADAIWDSEETIDKFVITQVQSGLSNQVVSIRVRFQSDGEAGEHLLEFTRKLKSTLRRTPVFRQQPFVLPFDRSVTIYTAGKVRVIEDLLDIMGIQRVNFFEDDFRDTDREMLD